MRRQGAPRDLERAAGKEWCTLRGLILTSLPHSTPEARVTVSREIVPLLLTLVLLHTPTLGNALEPLVYDMAVQPSAHRAAEFVVGTPNASILPRLQLFAHDPLQRFPAVAA
jgi:hypothetical protein